MTIRTPENEPHPDENDISSGWQRANIFRVGLKPSAQPQRICVDCSLYHFFKVHELPVQLLYLNLNGKLETFPEVADHD